MRGSLRAGLVPACIILILAQGALAFTVTGFQVNPPDEWLPGTPVAVSATIDFTPSPGEKFDNRHDLRFNTTLENVQWRWTSSVKGVATPVPTLQNGVIGPVPDYTFHYPENDKMILKFLLQGEAPAVSGTTTTTILRIQEVDEKGILIPGSSREYGEVVVYSEGPVEKANSVRSSLEAFRDHLDEKALERVNTIVAETKYQMAQQKIENSTTLPSSYYNALIEKYRILDSAQKDIDEGERFLDKAWAEKEVAEAQEKVALADMMIGWFKGNGSTANYYRVDSFIADRDDASEYIASATDDIENSNYSLARLKAQAAFLKANESFNNATSSRNLLFEYDCCNHSPFERYGTLVIATGIGVVALLIIGIIWWKKRKP
jgi:hypothetical protein